jgi:hypothetical protein
MAEWSLAEPRPARYAGDELLPDGKVLTALGKEAKAARPGLVRQPASVAVASNGDALVAEGHAPTSAIHSS